VNPFQKSLHEEALSLSKLFRNTESDLIEVLMKIDEAKVFLALGYSSLYSYALEALDLSEANAYAFSAVAKKSKQIPELKTEIKSGNLSVSNARRVLSVITPQNKMEWIAKAAVLPKIELEKEVFKANPEAEKKESIRQLSEDRFSLKLGISEDLLRKLKRAQVLLMNKGRKNLGLENVLAELTEEFLEKNDPLRKAERITEKKSESFCPGKNLDALDQNTQEQARFGESRRPISAALKHSISLRDKGLCQFQSEEKKCNTMAYVEIHHKKPVSRNGTNTLENLITLCSKHHKYLHEQR